MTYAFAEELLGPLLQELEGGDEALEGHHGVGLDGPLVQVDEERRRRHLLHNAQPKNTDTGSVEGGGGGAPGPPVVWIELEFIASTMTM